MIQFYKMTDMLLLWTNLLHAPNQYKILTFCFFHLSICMTGTGPCSVKKKQYAINGSFGINERLYMCMPC